MITMREVEAAIRGRGVEWDIDPTLDRMDALMDIMGGPQRAYPVIHLTGTNGKSSTARMVESLLRARGLRTGLYTSPELNSMRERIQIDGEPLSEERFVAAYDDVLPYIEMVDRDQPVAMSFFETLTAMAYAAFADAPVDVAIVEVGMGGRWDATNVADGAVAVITPVAEDHTRYLGSTAEEIAEEKAGIIKPGAITVVAQQRVTVAEVLMRHASEVGAVVAREGLEFGVRQREVAVGGQQLSIQGLHGVYEDIFLPLYGVHQASNAACAVAAVEAFAAPASGMEALVDIDLVRQGLGQVESPGRLEVVRRSPTVLVDAAHNPAGMAATVEAVQEAFMFTRLVGLVAVMADKDVAGILEPLEPLVTEIVVTRNSSARSMPPEELAELAAGIFGQERVHVAARMDDAVDEAIGRAEEEDDMGGAGVLATGSVVTAADVRTLLGAK